VPACRPRRKTKKTDYETINNKKAIKQFAKVVSDSLAYLFAYGKICKFGNFQLVVDDDNGSSVSVIIGSRPQLT